MHRYGRDYRTQGWEQMDRGSRGPGAHMYDYQQGYGRGGYDRGMQGWEGRSAGHGGGYMGGHRGGHPGGYDQGYSGGYDRGYMGGMHRGGWGYDSPDYPGGHPGGYHGGRQGGHEDRYRPDFRHPRADWGDGPLAGFDRPFFDRTTQDTVRRMALAPWNSPVPGMGYSLGHGVGRGRWL